MKRGPGSPIGIVTVDAKVKSADSGSDKLRSYART